MARKLGRETERLQNLLTVSEALNHVKDLDSLLDRILYEARRITNADAGSIYLVEDGTLRFSYTQNESLFSGVSNANKYLYANHVMPIDEKSIAGHVAVTGQPLLIENAYEIGEGVPYSFNRSFDESSGYRTQSMLTVALKTSQDKLVGVMQIINALDPETKQAVPFTETDRLYVSLFGNNAAVAIDRSIMTREIVLRMIRMAELRDPRETGAHVNRVAAYSIEIYQRWGEKRKLPSTEIKRFKDHLRIAAMLHDVGKVAIPDAILKKPAKLNDDEYALMQTHSIVGARLFRDSNSDWDVLAAEIALNHHERWDGKGYPGKIEDIYSDPITLGPGKKEEEIPIAGRIVGLADVYDALMSKRTYKDAWEEADVLEYVREQSGKQFDPEIVTCFLDIYDVIKAIREKYAE